MVATYVSMARARIFILIVETNQWSQRHRYKWSCFAKYVYSQDQVYMCLDKKNNAYYSLVTVFCVDKFLLT
jgi:hypothetical protein